MPSRPNSQHLPSLNDPTLSSRPISCSGLGHRLHLLDPCWVQLPPSPLSSTATPANNLDTAATPPPPSELIPDGTPALSDALLSVTCRPSITYDSVFPGLDPDVLNTANVDDGTNVIQYDYCSLPLPSLPSDPSGGSGPIYLDPLDHSNPDCIPVIDLPAVASVVLTSHRSSLDTGPLPPNPDPPGPDLARGCRPPSILDLALLRPDLSHLIVDFSFASGHPTTPLCLTPRSRWSAALTTDALNLTPDSASTPIGAPSSASHAPLSSASTSTVATRTHRHASRTRSVHLTLTPTDLASPAAPVEHVDRLMSHPPPAATLEPKPTNSLLLNLSHNSAHSPPPIYHPALTDSPESTQPHVTHATLPTLLPDGTYSTLTIPQSNPTHSLGPTRKSDHAPAHSPTVQSRPPCLTLPTNQPDLPYSPLPTFPSNLTHSTLTIAQPGLTDSHVPPVNHPHSLVPTLKSDHVLSSLPPIRSGRPASLVSILWPDHARSRAPTLQPHSTRSFVPPLQPDLAHSIPPLPPNDPRHSKRTVIDRRTGVANRRTGHASKISRVTVTLDRTVLVPTNGHHAHAGPITNVTMLPLHLAQSLLSPGTPCSRRTGRSSARSSALIHSGLGSGLRSSFPPSPPATTPVFVNTDDDVPSLAVVLRAGLAALKHNFLHMIRRSVWLGRLKRMLQTALQAVGPARVPRPPKLHSLTQAEKTAMFSDHYCCFAIPLYNTGIYVILAQFTVFGLVMGMLSFCAPSVLAIAIPGSLTAIFGTLCMAIGLAQAVGFYGVYKEKAAVFRKYIFGNAILVLAALIYSLGIIVLSSTRHELAIQECLVQFVTGGEERASQSSQTVCNIWTWAQLGVCGLLWVLFAVSEIYFCLMERVWGKDQKIDHLKYRTIVSAARESMARMSEDWEARSRGGSLDVERLGRHHMRTQSGASVGSARLGATPAKSSRLRNEIEWKEIAVGERSREAEGGAGLAAAGKWVEEVGTAEYRRSLQQAADEEYYRTGPSRSRVSKRADEGMESERSGHSGTSGSSSPEASQQARLRSR